MDRAADAGDTKRMMATDVSSYNSQVQDCLGMQSDILCILLFRRAAVLPLTQTKDFTISCAERVLVPWALHLLDNQAIIIMNYSLDNMYR